MASIYDTAEGIKELTYLKARQRIARLDVLPFIPLYSIVVIGAIAIDWMVLYGLIAVALANGVTHLATHWAAKAKAAIAYASVKDASEAEFVCCVPESEQSAAKVCQVVLDPHTETRRFEFQKQRYTLRVAAFEAPTFPDTLAIDEYCTATKGLSAEEAAARLLTFGKNNFDVPIPTFGELFKVHAVAPFFVFQMFCVALWCLDEYWYYSVFTAIMLITFEGTVVKQRLRSLSELRNMAAEPVDTWVMRGKWTKVPSTELVPGDICCMTRSKGSTTCPADMVLLRGSCIANEALLTGESMPQMKEPVWEHMGKARGLEAVGDAKVHMLYGGTKIMSVSKDDEVKPKLPEEGCVCYVTRTGFNTSQGQLMRTILFAAEAVTANTKESFLFILCLLVWGIAASAYVLHVGLQDPERSRYKLILNCIMIITSVVPPELPMELSLAVNNSLIALMGMRVYCTEPFRIPLGGKVEVCCFDKTGTLTSDHIVMKGCVLADATLDAMGVSNPLDLPDNVAAVLGGCSSLIHIDGELVGNATEKAALEAIDWTLGKGGQVAMPIRGRRSNAVEIHKRHHFSSALKRMSTVVSIDGSCHVLAKGAPEVMGPLMSGSSLPLDYDELHRHFSRSGLRVLALASKRLEGTSQPSRFSEMAREEVESGLSYVGLALFRCPLKSDSKGCIEQLVRADHRVVMITGDHALTACHVAKELAITVKPTLLLSGRPSEGAWQWEDVATGKEQYPMSAQNLNELAESHALCLDGAALASLSDEELPLVTPLVAVFARTSPRQKEAIVNTLRSLGKVVLMCGDGTNDVGALKAAEVGVGLIDEKALAASLAPRQPQTMQEKMNKLQHDAEAEERSRTPNFGDASIASPFTAKRASIAACVDVIRQGRCTLVSTLQMYKILGINCLVSAYCLSVLYMDGLKWGDTQMTLQGITIAAFFFFISRAKPLRRLAPVRPVSAVFHPSMVVSIVCQMLVHLYVLLQAVEMVKADESWAEVKKVKAEDDFKPSLFNTVVYLVYTTILLSIFTVNYQGHPHMQSLTENTLLLYGILFNWGINILLVLGVVPYLTETFELVAIPTPMLIFILKLMAVDLIGTLAIDRASSAMFGTKRR